jgi:hypothetical protein
MRYPINTNSQFPGDYLKITAHKYKARGGNEEISGGDYVPGSSIGGTASQRLGTAIGSVLLPLQSGLKEQNQVKYGEEELTFMEAAFGDAAFAMIQRGTTGPLNVADVAKQGIASLESSYQRGVDDPNMKNFLQAYFAGQAIGKNLRRRLTGSIANPNLELFFNAPTLRSFTFNFKLTPRESAEAAMIKRIIKFFKKSMNPRKSGSEAFLYTPDIFQLQYIYQETGQHPFLHRFKPVALQAFNVNYGNPTEYMTYGEDGSMPTYEIVLSFKELEPLYDNDFDTESDDMGF